MADPSRTAQEAHAAIGRFLAACSQPALVEPGEEHILLTPENHHVELRPGRLVVEAWDERRNVARRITGVRSESRGRLELVTERFGKQTGTLELIDLALSSGQTAARRAHRLSARDRFQRSLTRQFPGWTLRGISAAPDLEHSLSPAYPRALLVHGAAAWAAVGAPQQAGDPAAALTFGLIWLDYIRRRERALDVQGLVTFVPAGHERQVCLRVLHLDSTRARYRVFAYDDTYEAEIDIADHGNVESFVPPRAPAGAAQSTGTAEIVAALAAIPGVEAVECGGGVRSIRVRGLEIARVRADQVLFGLETKRVAAPSQLADMTALAREVSRARQPGADAAAALYQKVPELWLESQVRARIESVAADVLPAPVYGQVPAIAAADRGVIDLLAVDRTGRLAVVELKASEDPQLPLQALDYWIAVKWHLARGDFRANGYFPRIELRNQPPRLYLVAPALAFHPSSETILRHFSPEVDAERVGLGMNWRDELQVVFRMRGAGGPRFAEETIES